MVVEVNKLDFPAFVLQWSIDRYLYLCVLLVLLQCTSPIRPVLCKHWSSLATWPASATGSSSCSDSEFPCLAALRPSHMVFKVKFHELSLQRVLLTVPASSKIQFEEFALLQTKQQKSISKHTTRLLEMVN
ncbi:hypothetical protein GQ457_18G023670 [Hibiscus cannabinus]